MLGSLYGDLPQAKGEDTPSLSKKTWTTTNTLLPGRKPAGMTAPPSVLRAGGRGRSGPAPVATLAGGRGGRGLGTGVLEPLTSTASPLQQAGSILGAGIVNEYDPAFPNDYEQVRKERERARIEAELEAERQDRIRDVERQLEVGGQTGAEAVYAVLILLSGIKRLVAFSCSQAEQERDADSQRSPPRNALPPPSTSEPSYRETLKISGDEAFMRRAR